MKSMITENRVTFKDLEKNIYAWICQIGRQFTSEFLERYDQMLMRERDKGHVHGEKEIPVLFEEADGVYVKLQEKDRKKEKQDKAEIKVGIAYDGWKKTGKDRYQLSDKVVVAGFAGEKEFHEYREAAIAEKFNLDEVS